MPKAKQPKEAKSRVYYQIHEWQCEHHKDCSEIKAYVEASGEWETVLEARPTSGASAETLADFVCGLINSNQEKNRLMRIALEALQTCLDEGDLNFTSEQAADHAIAQLKKVGL